MPSHNPDQWRSQRRQAVTSHSQLFLHFLQTHPSPAATDLDAVEQELDNVLAGMERAFTNGRFSDVIDYASVLCRPESGCLGIRGYWSHLHHQLLLAVTAAQQSGYLSDEAALHQNMAVLAMSRGEITTAQMEGKTALEQFTQTGDTQGVAQVRGLLATLSRLKGDYIEARQELEALLKLFTQLEDKTNLAATYNQLGRLAEAERDGESARDYYQADLALEAAAGNKHGIGLAQWGLGNAAYLQNDLETALAHYQTAWQHLEKIGDKQNLTGLLGQLANLKRRLGETAGAEQLFWQVIDLSHELGDVVVESMALFNLATLYRQLDDLPRAITLLKQVVALEEQAGLADLERDRQALAHLQQELAVKEKRPSITKQGCHGHE